MKERIGQIEDRALALLHRAAHRWRPNMATSLRHCRENPAPILQESSKKA
jgi:hypothetical protein